MQKIYEISCQKACHSLAKSDKNFPYDYDLNIYRGCAHACVYCFAIYSHSYLNSGNFFEEIYVKTNIVEKL